MAKNRSKTPKVRPAAAADVGAEEPKVSARVRGGPRTPKVTVGPDAGTHRPTFSFRYADWRHEGDWSWPTGADAEEVLNFLCEMGSLTWQEIWAQTTGEGKRGGTQHRKHHFQEVDTLQPAARQRIAALRLDEIFGDEAFRFRVGGEKRLWGFIIDGVFYVLWWDVAHKVYIPKGR